MAGIKETKEVLAFVFSLGKATAAALEDGDLSWSDALKFVEPLKKIGPAIDDIEDVLVEVQDIDDEEFAELINYVRDEFDLSSITEDIEEIEMYVEDALNAVQTFPGVKRRTEYLGSIKGINVYDDYGHHPTEMKATISALKERTSGDLYVVFQPHSYTRTKNNFDDFKIL